MFYFANSLVIRFWILTKYVQNYRFGDNSEISNWMRWNPVGSVSKFPKISPIVPTNRVCHLVPDPQVKNTCFNLGDPFPGPNAHASFCRRFIILPVALGRYSMEANRKQRPVLSPEVCNCSLRFIRFIYMFSNFQNFPPLLLATVYNHNFGLLKTFYGGPENEEVC